MSPKAWPPIITIKKRDRRANRVVHDILLRGEAARGLGRATGRELREDKDCNWPGIAKQSSFPVVEAARGGPLRVTSG